MSESIYLYQSVSLSSSLQSVPSSSSHSLLTFPSIYYTVYTALLTTFHSHFWCDALPCHYDPCWLNNTLYILVYKITWTREESQFSPRMVVVVLRILNTCVLGFCDVFVFWSFWVLWPSLWFLICGLVLVLFLSVVVNF
jgi:hypothetical protein